MRTGQRFDVTVAFLSSARFVTALTSATIGTAALAFALRQTIGWAGLVGILGALVALFALVLVARRGEIEWSGLLPISLMVFVGWAGITVFFSQYQWASLGSLAYFVAFTVLGVAIALVRDTIQLIRAFGDVLRVTLFASLVVELIAGLLIDSPIRFLDVSGALDRFGPIQGIVGTRNQLGILAVIALITFATELRTRSVPRGLGIGSLALATLCLVLSQSPVAIGTAGLVALAAAALYRLRRTAPERRRVWQIGLLSAVVASAIGAWLFRAQIITALDATSELDYRLDLWRRVWDLMPLHPLEGWGWIGLWRDELFPFFTFRFMPGGQPPSAANAFLDVWFQLGIIGLLAFVVMVVLAFVRSWLLATARHSVVFTWPALVLLVLIMSSLAESSILIEVGWLTVVVCIVKASHELSWRQAFRTAPSSADLPHEGAGA